MECSPSGVITPVSGDNYFSRLATIRIPVLGGTSGLAGQQLEFAEMTCYFLSFFWVRSLESSSFFFAFSSR
jgi:hypothetical protein